MFDFSVDPIPAGFFGPGSDPFDGILELGGGMSSDTWIYKETDLCFCPPWPSTAATTTEVTSLNLVGCEDFTVTYGGSDPELWSVSASLDGVQPQGELTATREADWGGTFDSLLRVVPGFQFTGPGGAPILDFSPGVVVEIVGDDLPWVAFDPDPGGPNCSQEGFWPGWPPPGRAGCCEPTCHDAGPGYPPGHLHCVLPPGCPRCTEVIPAISEWGLMVTLLLFATAGTVVLGRRRRPTVAA